MSIPSLTAAEPRIDGYIIRPVTLDDIPAFLPLNASHLIEVFGQSNVSEDDIRSEWGEPKFDLASSTRAAFTPDGTMAAFAEVHDTSSIPVRPYVWGYTLPEFRGQGLGTALLRWSVARAHDVLTRVPDHARVVIESWANRKDTGTNALLRDNGFVSNRHSYHMHIDLDAAPEPVTFPDGYRVVTYNEQPDLEQFVRTHVASFRDHRGFVETPVKERVERWRHLMDSPYTDTGLWFLLLHGDEPAAIVIGNPTDNSDADLGWIEIVGTVPAYRRKGLALLLLRHAFSVYWARGIRKVALGVDGHSLTNATRLYEKAGMHVGQIWDAFEMEIRPGEELSRQE
jgi:GNAT superfamily N-acetyltransferase